VTLEQEGEDAQVFYVDPPLKLENELERQVQVSPVATRKRATMTVTVTDRKGVPLEGGTRSVTTPEFCLYTD
jgi:protocatechuate 3,4-dioxygenase beta subunit